MFKNNKANIFFLTLLSLLFGWQLLRPGFFSTHDDLQTMRLFQMDKCFSNGQIPCRWSPDMGGGYGQPTFNYYSATPYYFGEFFHLLGFSFVDTTKILFLLSLVFSAVFSYLFFVEFSSPISAFVGAIVYSFIPYRAVDIFVRGALAEVFALALIPLVLLYLIKLFKEPNLLNSLALSVSIFIFLCTHNISSITSLFVFVPLSLFFIYFYKPSRVKLKFFTLSLILGLGLSSFFVLPVAFERNLIQSSLLTQGYFDYNIHFASLKQLFLQFNWGYGPSEPGANDTISFAVGIIQTIGFFILPIFIIFSKSKKLKSFGIVFWLISLFTIFMTHNQSFVIWKSLPFFSYIQFPWRFLGIAALGLSAIWVIIMENLSNQKRKFVILLVIANLLINFNYFKFNNYLPTTSDTNLLSGKEYERQQLSAVSDYLPISSKDTPQTIAPAQPLTASQGVDITNFQKRSNYFSADIDIYISKADVLFPITYFPGWVIYDNNSPTPITFSYDNKYGQINLSLSKGHHKIQSFFENTPIRQISNTISFVSLFLLLTLYIVSKESNEKE